MKPIPESHRFLLEDETAALAFLATTMPDGSPQLTPVWFDVEEGLVRVNLAKGRVKDKNMRARPQVSLVIMEMNNPYFYIQLRGRVVEYTEEGADEHVQRVSRKYTGHDFAIPEGQTRLIFKIKPESHYLYEW